MTTWLWLYNINKVKYLCHVYKLPFLFNLLLVLFKCLAIKGKIPDFTFITGNIIFLQIFVGHYMYALWCFMDFDLCKYNYFSVNVNTNLILIICL